MTIKCANVPMREHDDAFQCPVAPLRFKGVQISMKFSPAIQYLRAVAAISVVIYHVLLHWLPDLKPRYLILSGGVDLFFIISGFVMWGVTWGVEGGSWSFLSKRLKRIVPLYWILTTVMLAIMVARPSVMLKSKLDIPHVVASYLFVPWIHPVTHMFEPLLFPGWTLNYEMFFYGIFALALFAPSRFRAGAIIGSLLAIVALGYIPHSRTSPVEFYTASIILEFAMGVALGALVTSGKRLPPVLSAPLALAGFGLLAMAVVTGMPAARALVWGIPAAMLVAGCVFLERSTGPRLATFPLLLGDASYSIYLVQVPIISALFQISGKVGVLHKPAGMALAMTATALVSVGAGVLVYWFVERPIIRRLKVPTPESKPLVESQVAA